MAFNATWLWIEEVRYHSIYVSALIYNEMGITLCTYAML
jgi:hypothetical protein